MDALTLARLQFGTTVVYHFLFVPLTLGLVLIVALMETLYVTSGNTIYKRMAQFWGQLYLINYAVGIVTGIVQEFQFGMNWSLFARFVGNVFGAPLAIETLLAFFVESTFLGAWIFGWDYLPKKAHLAVIWIVALGAYLSALWILTANAFMQHPVGYVIHDGIASMTNFAALLTNPNFQIAFPHVVAGGILTGACFVVGISAYHFLKRTQEQEFFRRSLRIGLILMLLSGIMVFAVGIVQIGLVIDNQPIKWAAGNSRWTVPATSHEKSLGAYQAEYEAQYGPGDYLPPVALDDTSFHLMMYIAIILLLLSITSLLLLIKGRLYRWRWFLWVLVGSIALPYIANISGWLFRETGRQPWIVYGVMQVKDGLSPNVSTGTLLVSLITFVLLYGTLAVVDGFLLVKYARLGTHTPQSHPNEREAESAAISY